jgi:four helix bundle protein
MSSNSRHQTTDKRSGAGVPRRCARHYSFRDLATWQRAQELSLLVLKVAREMPADPASAILVQQILRSATSVAANIAEGHGRFTAAAYRNHLSIARGSANETLSWIDLLKRADYISAERENELTARCDEGLRMISAQMIALSRSPTTRSAAQNRNSSNGQSDV